ncbi:MAG: hypothetical protein IKY13_02505 [Bacteroidaceae bacterium]|nr:hypothetical protein [Bacteroidaceae bacterium]
MKRILSLMLVAICCIGIATAQETSGLQPTTELNVSQHTAPRGYRGFVELAPITPSTSGATLNLSTTHGYQFNHNFFLGGGIGYYTYLFSQYGETDVPLYIAVQSNVGEKMAQFTYGGRAGILLYTKHEYMSQETYTSEIAEGFGGLYFNFNLGLRLGFTPQYAMTIKPQFELLLGGFPTLNVGIGFGFEF